MKQNQSLCVVSRFALLGVVLLSSADPLRVIAEGPDSPRYTKTVESIRQAEPAVVNIEGNKPASSVSGVRSDAQQVNGMGAGVIIDARGYILTNQHVIQDVGRIEVTLNSGQQYVGRLIARDPATDLALIKIDPRGKLPVIRMGTSSDLMRGEPVIAIGNPFGYHHTVTEGIISALHRDIPVNGVQDYPDLIQTDASINPGNSGGPLLNAEGDMIGINAAVRMGAQGIGFAIPVDHAAEVAAEMIARHRRDAFVSPMSVKTGHDNGKSFVRVVRSNLDEVRSGDLISSVNGREIKNRLDYELALVSLKSGSRVDVKLARGENTLATNLKLGRGSTNGSQTRLASISNGSSVKDLVYRKLGVRLEPANANTVRRVDASYQGGLRITSVRKNSPAYEAQIQAGDVLVGLLEWQTPDWADLDWILKSNEMRTAKSPKFHIMRGKDVFWGNLDLTGALVR